MDKLVGKNIKKYRSLRDIKQGELADLVGISMSHLSRIETGKVSADTELLGRMAAALRIGIKDFFEEEILPEGGTNIRENAGLYFSLPGHLSHAERERIQEMVKKLETVPPNDREMVFELLDTIFRRAKEK